MIGIGSDHNGFELKQRIAAHLAERGEAFRDFGAFTDEPVDYPEVAAAVAEAIAAGVVARGILACGTGLGMAIAANKVPGIYAATVTDPYTARLSRERNNVQIIALGANVVGPGRAFAIVDAWLGAEFVGGDSARKIAKIRALEERYSRELTTAMTGGRQW